MQLTQELTCVSHRRPWCRYGSPATSPTCTAVHRAVWWIRGVPSPELGLRERDETHNGQVALHKSSRSEIQKELNTRPTYSRQTAWLQVTRGISTAAQWTLLFLSWSNAKEHLTMTQERSYSIQTFGGPSPALLLSAFHCVQRPHALENLAAGSQEEKGIWVLLIIGKIYFSEYKCILLLKIYSILL